MVHMSKNTVEAIDHITFNQYVFIDLSLIHAYMDILQMIAIAQILIILIVVNLIK